MKDVLTQTYAKSTPCYSLSLYEIDYFYCVWLGFFGLEGYFSI